VVWKSGNKLARAEGGSLFSEEVARLLGTSETAVLQRLKAGGLIAFRQGRRRAARFSRWQFDRRSRVLAGLEEVLKVLNRGQRLDAWSRILFFLHTRGGVCLAAEAYVIPAGEAEVGSALIFGGGRS
jgi:hypothetical protein